MRGSGNRLRSSEQVGQQHTGFAVREQGQGVDRQTVPFRFPMSESRRRSEACSDHRSRDQKQRSCCQESRDGSTDGHGGNQRNDFRWNAGAQCGGGHSLTSKRASVSRAFRVQPSFSW